MHLGNGSEVLSYEYAPAERDLRAQGDHKTMRTMLPVRRASVVFGSSFEIVQTRTQGTPLGPVVFDEELVAFRMVSPTAIVLGDAAIYAGLSRMRLIRSGRNDFGDKDRFEQPSNVLFLPPEYVSINCCIPCPTPTHILCGRCVWQNGEPVECYCAPPPPCGSGLSLISSVEATVPSNRARTRLGVGEAVQLSVNAAASCSVSWSLIGEGTLSATSGISVRFTAHDRASTPTVRATVNGVARQITYNVLEPSGITIEREPGTGIEHTVNTSSVGFIGRAWYSPTDVSFINIQVRERGAPEFSVPASATGFYSLWNGLQHDMGPWAAVVPGTDAKGSKDSVIDSIHSGQRNPPYSPGTLTWSIPWEFRVGTGAGKVFTTVTHQSTATATGQTTVSKGGHSETRSPADPTSSW